MIKILHIQRLPGLFTDDTQGEGFSKRFVPAADQKRQEELQASFDFRENMIAARDGSRRKVAMFGKHRAQLLELSSVEASKTFDDRSLDMVFVDGDHSYEATLEDILHWWPKLRRGGVMAGHDFGSNVEVSRAVMEFRRRISVGATGYDDVFDSISNKADEEVESDSSGSANRTETSGPVTLDFGADFSAWAKTNSLKERDSGGCATNERVMRSTISGKGDVEVSCQQKKRGNAVAGEMVPGVGSENYKVHVDADWTWYIVKKD